MDYDELRERGGSEIETALLEALYPKLNAESKREIEAQHLIDYYDISVTLPDFAFPKLRIAIYCDGYEHHSEKERFQKDREQSRNLQLRGWCVLRFAGTEIQNNIDGVVRTIQAAIEHKTQELAEKSERLRLIRLMRRERPIGGAFTAGLVAGIVLAIVLMILI